MLTKHATGFMQGVDASISDLERTLRVTHFLRQSLLIKRQQKGSSSRNESHSQATSTIKQPWNR